MAPEIKGNQQAQVCCGLTLGLARIPVAFILYWLWARKQKKTGKLVLHKYINWKIILLTLVFGCLIDPVHTLVVNAGGSVGYQTMFSLSDIPVIVGGYFLFHKHLTIKKRIGIVVACAGMWLMST